MGSIAVFGVEFQGWKATRGELFAQFPLQQRLDKQSNKEDEHIDLHAFNLLEKQRSRTMHILEL